MKGRRLAGCFWSTNMIHRNKLKIYILLTLLWSALIFSFSLQPADASGEVSSGFGEWLIETFVPGLQDDLEALPEEQYEFLHHILRKCAHFTEYFILGVLVMLTFLQTRQRLPWLKGIGVGALVACLDETIQLFVEGRSGQVKDVLLDSTGVAVGICFIIFIMRCFKKNKR